MARQAVAVQAVPITGLIDPTANAAHADGHAIPNNRGKTVITIINENGDSAVTASFTPTDQRVGLDRETLDIEIADGAKAVITDLPADVFEQRSGDDKGKVYLNFDGSDVIAGVTIEAFTT